ncbi:MAG TPA: pyocin knob domain-containing protein [Clostridia bacterium]|nr:pyocin knob domain-containing protein [Clostridia bacterium]
MAYVKTTWVDHVEDPITGEVYTQGTPVDATHLNKMEQGIADAIPASEKGQSNGVVGANGNNKANPNQISSLVKGVPSSRALSLSDAGQYLVVDQTSNVTITVPSTSSVAFPNDSEIFVHRLGSGEVNFASESGIILAHIGGEEMPKCIPNRYGTVKLKKITSTIWILENDVPPSHKHSDLTPYKKFFNLASYINRVIPLVSLDNTDVAANSYFSGDILLRRKTGLYSPRHIRLTASKKDTSEEVVWSALSSANNPAEGVGYRFVTFLYGGKKYFGLQLFCVTASYDTVELFGECSNWDAIVEKSYYNIQTSTVLNEEINGSLTILPSSYSYHRAQEFLKTPVVRDNNSDTAYEVLHRGNMGASMQMLDTAGRTLIPTGSNFNSLIVGGSYYVGSSSDMSTMINPPKLGQGGYVDVRKNGAIVAQVYQAWGTLYISRVSNDTGATWSAWTSISDGGNAAKLNNKDGSLYFNQIAGELTSGSLLEYINSFPVGTIGSFLVGNMVTDVPKGGYYVCLIVMNQSANLKQVLLLSRTGTSGRYSVSKNTAVWSEWVDLADGGNAALLSGKAINVSNGIPTLDEYGKVNASQTSSRIVGCTGPLAIEQGHLGTFIYCYNANVTVTIPNDAASPNIPIGAELEVFRGDPAYSVNFVGQSGVSILSIDNAKSIANGFGVVALKKLNPNSWLLSGDLG